MNTTTNTTKKPRGFAALHPDRVKEIAKRGGVEAHRKGRAHKWTSETARAAGSKGGRAAQAKHAAKKADGQVAKAKQAKGEKDPNRLVRAHCNAQGGSCVGITTAKQAGGEMAGELTAKQRQTAKDGNAGAEAPEAFEGNDLAEGTQAANCSHAGGCGSSK